VKWRRRRWSRDDYPPAGRALSLLSRCNDGCAGPIRPTTGPRNLRAPRTPWRATRASLCLEVPCAEPSPR
jgi:hypothetical protein